VRGTPFDFTTPQPIGARIAEPDPQLRHAEPSRGGYDINYVLNRPGDLSHPAARVTDPGSGRSVELRTTEPGLQLYSSNRLGDMTGRQGRHFGHWSAFTLEAQHFPDSPNRPGFPSTVLRPGERYRQTTLYRFTAG
jgi:aldose 1-epimerase